MKNIIKNILSVAVLSTVTMASALTVHAQNMTEPYQDVNGICFKKSASLNPDGHTYTVTLESFVKGEVKIVTSVKPADIVLVLDVSGSMLEAVSSDRLELLYPTVPDGYRYYDIHGANVSGTKTHDYILYEGEYYLLRKLNRNVSGTDYRCVYFERSSRCYYLKNDGTVHRSAHTGTSVYNDDAQAYGTPGNVYVISWPANASYSLYREIAKIDILKQATERFIDVVNEKDPDVEGTGHQIAIAAYSTGLQLTKELTPIAGNVSQLKEAVNGLSATGQTEINKGIIKAEEWLEAVKSQDRSRFVVVFTDGKPTGSVADGTAYSSVADEALAHAKTIKASGDNDIKGKVFSVGMVPSNEAPEETNQFLNYLSSNYPNASSMSNHGSGTMGGEYYYNALNGDLSDIFQAIAEQAAGGAENTQVTSESAITVDAVSADFHLPSNASEGDVTLMYAKCNGEDANEYLTFGTPMTPAQAVAAGMYVPEEEGQQLMPRVVINRTKNTVSVENFDFSKNWCGHDDEISEYRGFKQILSFRIEIDEGAVGGPATATNEANSGIYVNGQPIAVFNQPQVVMPVSIWIQKQGLEGSDSAVFTLKRSEKTYEEYRAMGLVDANGYLNPKDSRITYLNFTKVVVNDNTMDADGVVKITGLDARYIYTIKEDAWAEAAYDYENGTQYTLKVNKTDKEPSNPFIFINTPNASHANAKVGEDNSHNVFNVK